MDKKIPPGHKPTAASNDAYKLTDTSLFAQRFRLLQALHQGPITTFYARDKLNILMPAARVKELRDLGYAIHTELIRVVDSNGHHHNRVARYSLLKMAQQCQMSPPHSTSNEGD